MTGSRSAIFFFRNTSPDCKDFGSVSRHFPGVMAAWR
jgi:hypothetical protein